MFEVPLEEADVMETLIKTEMEHVVSLSVPLKVSLGKDIAELRPTIRKELPIITESNSAQTIKTKTEK